MDAALLSLPLETLRTRLAEATEALHKLAIGDRVVSVQSNGRRAEFSDASIDKLKSYIAELQSAIAAKQTGAKSARKPVYLSF